MLTKYPPRSSTVRDFRAPSPRDALDFGIDPAASMPVATVASLLNVELVAFGVEHVDEILAPLFHDPRLSAAERHEA